MQTLNKTKTAVKKNISLPISKPSRSVEWFGGVNYDNLERALGRIKELMLEDQQGEIQLLVNSYGGGTGIGMGFYDTVTSWLKPNLTTVGSGDVDSSGIIVFLAGKKRYLTRNTTLLLHMAGRTFEANKRFSTREVEDMLSENRLKDYQYACVVADCTNGRTTPEKILDLMAKNTILTAEEAVNLGLADKVIE